MIITYIRSSLLSNFSFCEMQSFITYNLGVQRKNAKKALLGTMTHKVLELLAQLKLEYQINKTNTLTLNDDIVSNIELSWDDLNKPYLLSNTEVEQINKTRLNKSIYLPTARINYGHICHGYELVNHLTELVFQKYASQNEHIDWEPIDLKHVKNWVWMAVDYREGLFDPRRQNIRAPEIHFDIPIDRPWAKYKYYVGDKVLEGNLAIKGTIDLVTNVEDGIEIVDYKTGQRKDWATDEVKDYKKLCQDKQLMLYYYAARHVFPDIHNIMLSIFFVRDGGPFTIHFGDEDLDSIEQMLRIEMKKMQSSMTPRMIDPYQRGFKCTKICDYYKQQIGDTNLCKHINNELNTIGIDQVIQKYKEPNFDFDMYEAPGE